MIASNTLTFCYNGFNQLTNVTDSDNNLTVYIYNAQGLRTSKHKANDGTSTKFYYDGSANIILETTAENAVTAKNIRGLHLISRENAGAEPFYYLFNAHGDVTKLVDELGNVIKDYSYDPFGNEKSSELNPLGGNLSISLWQTEAAAIDNPFRYCGEYLDFETNNYYLRARYYDTSIQRFTQEDTHWNPSNMIYGDKPVKLNDRKSDEKDLPGLNTYIYKPNNHAIRQSGNLYIYCLSNPIMYTDPNGNAAGALLLGAGAANFWNPVGWVLVGAGVIVTAVTVYAVVDNTIYNISKKQQKIDAKKGIRNPTVINSTPPGPPKNNQEQNKQAKEAAQKYKLSKEGQEALHRQISKQHLSRNEIFEVAKSIAKQGGKYVTK